MSNQHSSFSSPPIIVPPNSKRTTWLVVLAAIGLVAGPVGVRAFPQEVVRWRIAAAAEARLKGDSAQADKLLTEILESDSTDSATFFLRGRWRLHDRDYAGACADFSRVLELQPRVVRVYELRGTALLHLQRYDEAIADADEVFAFFEKSAAAPAATSKLEAWLDDWLHYFGIDLQAGRGYGLAHARNGQAYARAVANRDLAAALAEINAAIEVVRRLAPSELPSLLDTRGFVLYRLGEFQPALDDLNLAIAKLNSPLVDNWPDYARENSRNSPDPRQLQARLHAEKETLAVLSYHRMLIHTALGNTAEADVDRQRVVTLGFEPNDQLF